MNNVTALSLAFMCEAHLYTHTEWLYDLRQNFQSESTYGYRPIQTGDGKRN